MGNNFTQLQLENRQNLIKQIFTDKKEYFYYRDLHSLISGILLIDDKEDFDLQTLKFLDTYRKLVEKTKQEHIELGDDVECCCGVFVMEVMRDDPNFQKAYKSLQNFLVKRIESCHKKTNPAEETMAQEEIQLVLFEKPGLISRCAKPSWSLQNMVCQKSPRVIQFIDEPDSSVVRDVIRRDVKNILLIKPEFRTVYAEVEALIADIIKLNQLSPEHKKRLIEHDYDKGFCPCICEELIKTIEAQSTSLTSNQLETFRLNAVGWDKDIEAIKYMRNPSQAVKEKAVKTNPEFVKYIKFQYPAIQKLALFCAFKKACMYETSVFINEKRALDSVYEQMHNVMPEAHEVYEYLKKLYCDFPNITKLKYQNEQIQYGLLYLAEARQIDVHKIFTLFHNPSKDVLNIYNWVLKRQAEETVREIRRKEFESLYYGYSL